MAFYFAATPKLEELMWRQSLAGYENFLSTTTDYQIARKHPKYEKNSGVVYVLKVPLKQTFRNYGSVVSRNEGEILVVDYVLPDSIIATIDPKKTDYADVRDFM